MQQQHCYQNKKEQFSKYDFINDSSFDNVGRYINQGLKGLKCDSREGKFVYEVPFQFSYDEWNIEKYLKEIRRGN